MHHGIVDHRDGLAKISSRVLGLTPNRRPLRGVPPCRAIADRGADAGGSQRKRGLDISQSERWLGRETCGREKPESHQREQARGRQHAVTTANAIIVVKTAGVTPASKPSRRAGLYARHPKPPRTADLLHASGKPPAMSGPDAGRKGDPCFPLADQPLPSAQGKLPGAAGKLPHAFAGLSGA
ncbi:MAG TPA: hypothetical protein VGD81_20500 [Opitutaceae bacterium]